MSFNRPKHDTPFRTEYPQRSKTYRLLNKTILEFYDTALAIQNRRGVDLVLHTVYEPIKLCYVVSIVHFEKTSG